MLYVRFKCSASGDLRALPKFAGRATNLLNVRKSFTPSMSSPWLCCKGIGALARRSHLEFGHAVVIDRLVTIVAPFCALGSSQRTIKQLRRISTRCGLL